MHRLKAITALGGTEPRVDQHGPITLSEKSGFALASVAARVGGTKATTMAIKRLTGAPVPGPGQTNGTKITAFWT